MDNLQSAGHYCKKKKILDDARPLCFSIYFAIMTGWLHIMPCLDFFFFFFSKMAFFCPSFESEFYQLSPTMCKDCLHKAPLIYRIESLVWSNKAAYYGMLQVRLKVAQLAVSQCLKNVYLMLMKYSCWSEWKRITGNSSVRMPLSSFLSCHLMHQRMRGRHVLFCMLHLVQPDVDKRKSNHT